MRFNRPSRLRSTRLALALGLAALPLLAGCNDAQKGALLGAGAGALAGQAIGGNTKSTLIGTAVGAGVGYAVGNESDKARHQREHYHNGNYDY